MDRTLALFVRVNRSEHSLAQQAARAERLGIAEYVRHLVRRDAEQVLGTARTREIFAETATDA